MPVHISPPADHSAETNCRVAKCARDSGERGVRNRRQRLANCRLENREEPSALFHSQQPRPPFQQELNAAGKRVDFRPPIPQWRFRLRCRSGVEENLNLSAAWLSGSLSLPLWSVTMTLPLVVITLPLGVNIESRLSRPT